MSKKSKLKIWFDEERRARPRRLPSLEVCARALSPLEAATDEKLCASWQPAIELFVAFALVDGATPEAILQLLYRLVPHPCNRIGVDLISQTRARLDEILTLDVVMRYIAAHPFRWELELSPETFFSFDSLGVA